MTNNELYKRILKATQERTQQGRLVLMKRAGLISSEECQRLLKELKRRETIDEIETLINQ